MDDKRLEYLEDLNKTIYTNENFKRLRITHDKGKAKYYLLDKGDRVGTYISTKDTNKIKELVKEYFYLSAHKEIQAEIQQLKQHVSFDFETLYKKLPAEMQQIISLGEILEDEYVKKWKAIPWIHMTVSDNINFYTHRGEHVRSKSEVIIANLLNKYNVPYHYEPTMHFGKTIKCPDFLILNTMTREEFIWEHFGMMDNEQYCSEAIDKISFYAKHGYVLGKNLLITMESSKNQLDVQLAEKLITEYLI